MNRRVRSEIPTLHPSVQEYLALCSTACQGDGYTAAVIGRDRVEELLRAGQLQVADLTAVGEADDELRKAAAVLSAAVTTELSHLRDTVRPPKEAWWWNTAEEPLRPWPLVSGAMFALTAAFAAGFARDTLAANPDAWGLIAVAAQATLTFVAGSTFTEAGRRTLKSLLRHTGGTGASDRLIAAAAALIAALTIVLWLFVPEALANHYNQQALDECGDNQPCDNIPRALELFKRAESLDKSHSTASLVHYNFGRVYELANDYASAIGQYQLAVQDDPDSPSALNNWAWLLLMQNKELSTTLRLLDEAVARVDKRMLDGSVYFAAPSVYKNRGLANQRAGFVELAELDLKKAIQLQESLVPRATAAPHCVLAAVLEKLQGRREEAVAEAKVCIMLSQRLGPEERTASKIDPTSFRISQLLAAASK